MTTRWIPFEYRDFYDVPRAVVVQVGDRVLLLDCLLDLDAEEYPDSYQVYEISPELSRLLEDISWVDLGHRAEHIETLAIEDVRFDESRRESIDGAFVERTQKL